jgi:hypothetical protein
MRYRDQRFPSDKDVWLEHEDGTERVQVADISSSGARLLHLEQLPDGSLVTLRHLHLRVSARVMRSNDEQTTVRFVVPLSTTDRDVLRGAKGGHMAGWGSSAQHGFRELS